MPEPRLLHWLPVKQNFSCSFMTSFGLVAKIFFFIIIFFIFYVIPTETHRNGRRSVDLTRLIASLRISHPREEI